MNEIMGAIDYPTKILTTHLIGKIKGQGKC